MAIASRVIKTIDENTKDGKTWGMWVMQYYDPEENKSIRVKLIVGEKKVKEDGDIWYVAKGMSVKDFNRLRPIYPEFVKLSENPPPIDVVESTDDGEEVPF